MKAVIVNYTGGRSNWGSQATSEMLAKFLAETLAEFGLTKLSTVPLPPPHISDTRLRRKSGSDLEKLLAERSPSSAEIQSLHELTRSRFGDLYARIEDADVVFFQGEGSIGGSKFASDLRLLAMPYLAALLHKKRLFTLNQSISMPNLPSQRVIANLFDLSALNFLRETSSLDTAKGLGFPDCHFCPDTVFLIKGSQITKEHGADYFCVSGSAILDSSYIKNIAGAISQISIDHGISPVFLAATGIDEKLYSHYRDNHSKNCKLVKQSEAVDYRDILPILASAAFTVGGRYHTSIKSAALGVPVILLESNSQKSNGLSNMLFGESRVRRSVDVKLIVADAGKIMASQSLARLEVRNAVQSLMPHFQKAKDLIKQQLISDGWSKTTTNAPLQIQTKRTPLNFRQRKFLGYSKGYLSLSANLANYDCLDQVFQNSN